MDLKTLSEIQELMDRFNNSLLDLKEAIIDKSSTEMEEKFFLTSRKEVINVLKSSLSKKETELTVAQQLVKQNRLLDIVCNCARIDKKELLLNRTKKREFVIPRQVHMAFLHKTFSISQDEVGAIYDRDHATVLHSCKTVKNEINTYADYREKWAPVIDFCLEYDILTKRNRTTNFLKGK